MCDDTDRAIRNAPQLIENLRGCMTPTAAVAANVIERLSDNLALVTKQRDELSSRGPEMQFAINAACDALHIDRFEFWLLIQERLATSVTAEKVGR